MIESAVILPQITVLTFFSVFIRYHRFITISNARVLIF